MQTEATSINFQIAQDSHIKWCIQQHMETNHRYDNYLPYEFHLRMTVKICKEFSYLSPEDPDQLELAAWGHDLIEDTRVSYNDVRKVLGTFPADIIYAVTNDKGKTRTERAGEKYYAGILAQPGAAFIKLCDRIANAEYSAMTQSRMLNVYREENESFEKRLNNDNRYLIMFARLRKTLSIAI